MFLKKQIREKLKKLVPERVFMKIEGLYLEHGPSYYIPSYSQEGEDAILLSLFAGRTNGCYVDVGAHHPKRFSNTFLFYRLGWRGINIEPNPDYAVKFMKKRKDDINIQSGIGPEDDILEYFQFEEAALNTFDRKVAEERITSRKCRLVKTMEIPVKPLASVLEEYLGNRRIDFLDVDTEGMDLKVLMSNDWNRHRPGAILVEMTDKTVQDSLNSGVFEFLSGKGYDLIAKTQRTGIFLERENQNNP